MEDNKMKIEDELAKTRNEKKRIELLLEEMESSIKEMNRKMSVLRKEIKIKYEELDEIENSRRKKLIMNESFKDLCM